MNALCGGPEMDVLVQGRPAPTEPTEDTAGADDLQRS
jgi:hypothetical protein